MTDFDDLFPKPDVSMPTARKTLFGRYPARIRSVADAFMETMGWNADPTTIRIVAAGAKRFVDVHGENPELVVRTINRLERTAKHIYDNIASPGSLITAARKSKVDSDSEAGRRKFETDFWEVDDDTE